MAEETLNQEVRDSSPDVIAFRERAMERFAQLGVADDVDSPATSEPSGAPDVDEVVVPKAVPITDGPVEATGETADPPTATTEDEETRLDKHPVYGKRFKEVIGQREAERQRREAVEAQLQETVRYIQALQAQQQAPARQEQPEEVSPELAMAFNEGFRKFPNDVDQALAYGFQKVMRGAEQKFLPREELQRVEQARIQRENLQRAATMADELVALVPDLADGEHEDWNVVKDYAPELRSGKMTVKDVAATIQRRRQYAQPVPAVTDDAARKADEVARKEATLRQQAAPVRPRHPSPASEKPRDVQEWREQREAEAAKLIKSGAW